MGTFSRLTNAKGEDHFVVHASSGKKIGYRELASAAAKQPLPAKNEIRLKSPTEFRYIGKGVPITDLKDICTGRAIYGFDAHVPGMVYASIERPPVLGGKLKSFDDSAAKQVAGVEQTVVLDGAQPPYGFQALGGVAVIANNTWAASQGRKKLKIEWESGPHAIFDSENYKKSLIETANSPQQVVRTAGDVDNAFTSAAKVVEANYYTPLLAHAPMEPPAALARFNDGKVEIWAATQNPQAVQTTVATALGIKPVDVICHASLCLVVASAANPNLITALKLRCFQRESASPSKLVGLAKKIFTSITSTQRRRNTIRPVWTQPANQTGNLVGCSERFSSHRFNL